jgi:type III secretion protein U
MAGRRDVRELGNGMADKNDSGDKTELPTAKRLRDARKKGDVAKSKDVGSAVVTLVWLIMIGLLTGFVVREIVGVTQLAITETSNKGFASAMDAMMSASLWALLKISLVTLLPIAILATFVEFAQIGSIFTTEKMKPSLDKLNPMEGLKRMFGKDGLVELIKTLIKALLVVLVVAVVLKTAINQSGDFIGLAQWSPLGGNGASVAEAVGTYNYKLTLQLFGLVVLVFIFVAILDRIYTKHAYIKKMMMSMRDIKQEHKEDEGDPYVKGARRQMHQEWANQNAVGSAGKASALLVNPTHIAIALDYDGKDTPVPIIAAKGEGALAAAMRAEAERMQVPIIRNVVTARRLWARGEVGEIVPEEMFDAVAEVILWAKKAKDGKAEMWTDLDAGKSEFLIRQEVDA